MSRRRSLSEEEHALWNGVTRSLTPLRRSRRSDRSPAGDHEGGKPPPAVPSQVVPQGTPAKEAPPLAPLGRIFKRRVARGREPIEARLDLHGFTQVKARAALLRFLRRAQADGVKIALVVTGKGNARGEQRTMSDASERGVLKRAVPMWLALPEFRPFVLGFEDASAGHGGAGALYVRLRRAR